MLAPRPADPASTVPASATPAPTVPVAPVPAAPPAVGKRLLQRLDAATARPTPEAIAALRAAVTELVDRLWALDLPLEDVLDVVETLLREHGVAPPRPALADAAPRAPEGAALRERVLDWCVRAYDGDDWW
jgi:hypothetical protein